MKSRVTLHMVASLDGFIAKKDNSISWMDSPGDVYEKGVTADGAEVLQSIDCYVLGSRTYEHAWSSTPATSIGWWVRNSRLDTETSGWWEGQCWPKVFYGWAWWMKSD
jgi:dihydrofolate reductase